MIVKPSECPEQESVNTTSAPKRMTRLSGRILFDKDLCIWCMEPDESNKKKKKISQNPFYRLEQKKSWRHICPYIPFLTDKEMRGRLLGIIALFCLQRTVCQPNEPGTLKILLNYYITFYST